MRLMDMRLLEGIERIPLGEIERYITNDSHRGATFTKWAMTDDRILHSDEDTRERRRPARFLASRFTNPKLTLDEQDDGSVIITRPDGVRVHVYRRAIEATIRKADDK